MAGGSPDRRQALPGQRPRDLPVHGVTPFTMLDFPERTACIIWFSGCNMRCGYCHNPQIVERRGRGGVAEVMAFLRRRQRLLDGVVLSGGEATLYPGLSDFIGEVRALGFAVKLDTNGSRPDVVEPLLVEGLLDYVALDYKAPPGRFKSVTGVRTFDAFSRTLDLLCAQRAVPFEVRTTVHTALLDEQDIAAIVRDLEARRYRGAYYVQNARIGDGRPTLGTLPPQDCLLNLDALPTPTGFELRFRNFP